MMVRAIDRVTQALESIGSKSRDGGRTWLCPAHDDQVPSLSVGQGRDGVVLRCHAGCETERIVALLALRMADLFDSDEQAARAPARANDRRPEIEIVGVPTEEQAKALTHSRRVVLAETLDAVGIKRIRCYGDEWLGIPALNGSWKLWAVEASGKPRLAGGKLGRRNAGPVSIVRSAALAGNPTGLQRLWDVEGESDLLACVEAGIEHVVASTGGATSLAGHDRQSEWLIGLQPQEVCVVGDLDDAGARGAEQRAAWWRSQGIPTRVVGLPIELGPKGDLRDYLNGRCPSNGSPATEPIGTARDLNQRGEASALIEPAVEPEFSEPDPPGTLDFPRDALRGTFASVVELLRPVTGASPAHIFASTWAALATCIGRARRGEWSGPVSTPTFLLCVGPTADHKSSAMDRVLALLPDTVRRVDGVTSDAGLFDALEDAEGAALLLHFDELGFLLKMAGISGQTLDSMLNRLWSAPQRLDRRLSKRNRDGGDRSVERPLVCLLAGTHVSTFWRQLDDPELAIGSGFVNRLAPFCVERGRSLELTREPDEQRADEIRKHLKRLTELDSAKVRLSPQSQKLWIEYAREHERRIAELEHPRSAVMKRVRDHVARLALVYATDGGRLEIEPADLSAAIEVGSFIAASYDALLAGRPLPRGAERESGVETVCRRLLSKRTGRAFTVRELQRGWPQTPAPSSREIRRALDGMGDIRPGPGGSRSNAYTLVRGGAYPTPDTQPREIKGNKCRVSDDASHAWESASA